MADLLPSVAAETLVRVLTGASSVGTTARALDVPVGTVLGWCERVGAALGVPERIEESPWVPVTGGIAVTHTVSRHTLMPGSLLVFTVTVTNSTEVELYGVTAIQRSFTDAVLRPLALTSPLRPLDAVDELVPGESVRFASDYLLDEDDLVEPGKIVNSVRVKAFTAAGACFSDEVDVAINVP
ncbi:hypothetical protein GCM10027416_04750 [Okibacterium endophyticum]